MIADMYYIVCNCLLHIRMACITLIWQAITRIGRVYYGPITPLGHSYYRDWTGVSRSYYICITSIQLCNTGLGAVIIIKPEGSRA
jgi:hypothetical protein